jgi:hypothetical protein
MGIELVPLATASFDVTEQTALPNGPFGTRIVAEIGGDTAAAASCSLRLGRSTTRAYAGPPPGRIVGERGWGR